MYIRVRAFARILEDIHAAWATVLLFVTKGNTRASVSGTARLQSRFLFVYMFAGKNMIFDILDYRKNAKKFAYVKKKQTNICCTVGAPL